MQPLTGTSWVQSVSRSRRILLGPTGRSVWGRTRGPIQLEHAPLPCLPCPSASGAWSGPPVVSVVLEVLGPGLGHGLTPLSACSERSMLPPSCTTSESWDRAQRVRKPQSGRWSATATRASGLASPPSGDAQVRGGRPVSPERWLLGELRGWRAVCGQELSGADPIEQRAEAESTDEREEPGFWEEPMREGPAGAGDCGHRKDLRGAQ